MSRFPTLEEILLELRQSLGIKQMQTKTKNKFALGELSLKNHFQKFHTVITEMLHHLKLNEQDSHDVINALLEFSNGYKTVELNTSTFGASNEQVLWYLLAAFIIPGVARKVAFWQVTYPLDSGMPGGQFWYLPTLDENAKTNKVEMPVTTVVEWLSDLLGYSLDSLADKDHPSYNDNSDSLIRTLHNWRGGHNTPNISSIIKAFDDDFSLPFKGTLELPSTLSEQEKFSATLKFIHKKNLDADQLRIQIPMRSEGRIESILEGKACESEQSHFVELICERYSQPSMYTIRQRLIIARMVQDGYKRLVKHLFPNTDPFCSNPEENKAIQLIGIYQYIHNLTVEAHDRKQLEGEVAENQYFESRLMQHPRYASTLFSSILPSLVLEKKDLSSSFLSKKFITLSKEHELDHIFGMTGAIEAEIAMKWHKFASLPEVKPEYLDVFVEALAKHQNRTALANQAGFDVVINALTDANVDTTDKRGKAWSLSLNKIARTPIQKIQAIIFELNIYFGGNKELRPPQCFGRVEKLIMEAKSNQCFEHFKAQILFYEALHHLSLNQFEKAEEIFKNAYDVSKNNHTKTLRGKAAHCCLSMNIINSKKISLNRQQKYYRDYMMFKNHQSKPLENFETTARECIDYFWEELYQPYSELEIKRPHVSEICETFMELFFLKEYKALKLWLKKNKHIWSKKPLDELSNSLLMHLIKCYLLKPNKKNIETTSSFNIPIPSLMQQKVVSVIKLVIKLAPNQLDMQDFKGQTPLMLVSENNIPELVQEFLDAGADANLQDYLGMTALHTAAKSINPQLIDLFLTYNVKFKATVDGRNVLHTAAWSTNDHAVRKILEVAPKLIREEDAYGQTPLECIEAILEFPPAKIEAINDATSTNAKRVTINGLKNIQNTLVSFLGKD